MLKQMERLDRHHTEDQQEIERRRGERRKRRQPVLVERRSGFDRRHTAPRGRTAALLADTLSQMRARPELVVLVVLTINLLSAVDALLTLNALANGAREANPVMRALIEQEPVLWIWVKALLVGTLSWVLWRLRRYRLGLCAALTGLAAFTAVLAYHIMGSLLLIS